MWGKLLSILLKAGGQILKKKSLRLVGKNVVSDIVKQFKMYSSFGLKKYSRNIKALIRIYKAPSKQIRNERLFYEATRKNNYLRHVYNIWKKEKEKQIASAEREYKILQTRIEQDMIYKFKNSLGVSKTEFTSFRDFFMKQTLGTKKFLKDLLKDEMKIVFESSWIAFGVFIPYGRKKDRGIMCLQLYNTTSKRNPKLFYQWVRVPLKTWEKITDTPTGRNFWKVWYKRNRDNKFYLTKDSIYWYNNTNKNTNKKNSKE